jgi:rod shape determining protein RodA
MKKFWYIVGANRGLIVGALFLVIFSSFILKSVAPSLFPVYYFYLLACFFVFFILVQIDFDILVIFSPYFYVISLALLIITLLVGQITRGAVRWIQLGPFSIQPTEIVKPFILLFFARLLTTGKLTFKKLVRAVGFFLPAFFLILIQPSLGVAFLIFIGFVGLILAADFDKKLILVAVVIALMSFPLIWQVLAPYQKERILVFLSPDAQTLDAAYNSIQSKISVGSGKLWGRGLGRGVQTQLAFLPERHTDFIFASIAEELGFVGASILLFLSFFVLYKIIKVVEQARSHAARAFVSGAFLMLFVQTMVHIGMNMGLLPITGVPLPLVSAGGSSLVSTAAILAMVISAKKC